MARSHTLRWLILSGVSAALLVGACVQVIPLSVPVLGLVRPDTQPSADGTGGQFSPPLADQPLSQATATVVVVTAPIPAPAASATTNAMPNGRTVTVRRGRIAASVQVDGRVAGTVETPVAFSSRTTPAKVNVKLGDAVEAGQVLVEADTAAADQALKDARDQLASAGVRLDQAQRAALARQQVSATNQQGAVAAAAEVLRQAQDDFARVAAGALDLDKQAADAVVFTTHAALVKAQSDLDRLLNGASASDKQAAQQAVTTAQVQLAQAQADAERLAHPDSIVLLNAQRDVSDAQTALATAQADLDRLTNGPDPFDLRAAQRNVDRAQSALDAANAMTVSSNSGTTQAAKNAAVGQAQASLADAQDALAKLKQPPKPDVVAAARVRVDDSRTTLANAQAKLDALRNPDQLALDKANTAVQNANVALDAAHTKLAQLITGASQTDIQAAQDAVDSATIAASSAQAKREAVYAQPTQTDLQNAQRRVDIAQRALDTARQGQPSLDTDQSLAEQELHTLQDQIVQREANLEATRVRAPFDGRVVAVLAQPGQALESGAPAVVLAKPGDPIVRITLPGAGASTPAPAVAAAPSAPALMRIVVGQQATIQVDGGQGIQLPGAVTGIVDGPNPNTRTAQIQVDWGASQARYGATVQVSITTQTKADALLVPLSALKSAGSSKYVEFLNGTSRVAQPVQVGITSDTVAEILSGLSEGQAVLAGDSTRAQATPEANGQPTPQISNLATPQPGAQATQASGASAP